jgi:hypothetical protein
MKTALRAMKTMTPTNWYDPLTLPGILTFFGVLTCWMAWLAEKNGKSAPWKWVGVIILVIALWVGFPYFSHMISSSPEDSLYRAGLPSIRRYSYAHYLAFFLPLIALIGCLVLQFIKKPTPPSTPAA